MTNAIKNHTKGGIKRNDKEVKITIPIMLAKIFIE
jgi:hypothetical protein